VTTGLARLLHDRKQNQGEMLENTEVVFVGMGCEEAGLRGAKRYVAKHKNDMQEIPTYGLFLDNICDENHLTVIHREVSTGAVHNAALVEMAIDVAAGRNWPITRALVPFGATDAAAFSLAGIPSTCLLCQDTSRLVPNYHTRLDTIETISPASLSISLQLVFEMVQRIDAAA
jgi:Zn-dependent M28 family amino/carboxypeptidase